MKTLLLAAALTVALAIPAQARTRPKAIIVVTSAENPQCQFGNINVAWLAMFRKTDDFTRFARRYVTSLDKCVVLPITAPIGTRITASGILGDRLAINGLSPSVVESCFNVEAYSIGLSSNGNTGELNPQDANNIINDQGYGLFWDETDANLQQTFTFTVVGCGAKCQMPKTIYNTDTGLIENPGCTVLAPLF